MPGPLSLAEFADLLRQSTGLEAESIGPDALARAVQERQSACSLGPEEYLERVRSSPSELQALAEAMVVRETWFFRETEAFKALARVAREEWLRTRGERALRLLSLPCASGEEPYSMAMALLDDGIPAEHFQIDAVDLSAHALVDAERGIYGKNSFRGKELGFRERYFTSTQEGHRIADAVRRPVRFQQGNLLQLHALRESGAYDVVFCRNLLIYFERASQDRAVQGLTGLLAERGWLFVAPSESPLLLRPGLAATKLGETFAFRKAPAAETKPAGSAEAPPARPAPAPSLAPPRAAARSRNGGRSPQGPPAAAPPAQAPATPGDLEAAGRLADQGRLPESIALCERHLKEHGPSAQVFHLLGLACDAAGHPQQADEYYRKALYLDPTHPEALLHLACLREKQGDQSSARLLRKRMQRAQGRTREPG